MCFRKCGIRISKIGNKKSNTMKRKRINQNRLEQYNLDLKERDIQRKHFPAKLSDVFKHLDNNNDRHLSYC